MSDSGDAPPGDPRAPVAPDEAPSAAEPATRAHRGRPRSVEADTAIAEATLRLLADVGYEGLSIEGVAAAAGVGKTTVYRRYRSKTELVLATMAHVDREAGPPPREMLAAMPTARDAVRFMVRGAAAIVATPGVLAALSNLLAGPAGDTEFAAGIRGQVFGPNIDVLRARLEGGIARGEVRSDAGVDAAIDAGFGALIARFLLGGSLDEAWQEHLVDTLWRGLEARDGGGRRAPRDGRTPRSRPDGPPAAPTRS